jgi:hypothetical protein
MSELIREIEKHRKELILENQQLRLILSELVDLMDGVREGTYQPDSFTTQPARMILDPPPWKQLRNLGPAALPVAKN